MSLKLLASATAAAFFAMGAWAQTSSSPSGSLGSGSSVGSGTGSVGSAPNSVGSSPNSSVGGSTGSGVGSSNPGIGGSTGSGSAGSATTGAGASSSRCATLTGLERDRCLRESGSLSGAGG
ncbi:MAG TPA: hypothetical protein VFA72_09635, partial [Burkholderiales bacterium]|nr:hypothetical protein [Burkholderiales bacterium]